MGVHFPHSLYLLCLRHDHQQYVLDWTLSASRSELPPLHLLDQQRSLAGNFGLSHFVRQCNCKLPMSVCSLLDLDSGASGLDSGCTTSANALPSSPGASTRISASSLTIANRTTNGVTQTSGMELVDTGTQRELLSTRHRRSILSLSGTINMAMLHESLL